MSTGWSLKSRTDGDAEVGLETYRKSTSDCGFVCGKWRYSVCVGLFRCWREHIILCSRSGQVSDFGSSHLFSPRGGFNYSPIEKGIGLPHRDGRKFLGSKSFQSRKKCDLKCGVCQRKRCWNFRITFDLKDDKNKIMMAIKYKMTKLIKSNMNLILLTRNKKTRNIEQN